MNPAHGVIFQRMTDWSQLEYQLRFLLAYNRNWLWLTWTKDDCGGLLSSQFNVKSEKQAQKSEQELQKKPRISVFCLLKIHIPERWIIGTLSNISTA